MNKLFCLTTARSGYAGNADNQQHAERDQLAASFI